MGRELITPDEVGRLDNNECILFIRGLKPFKSKKYDLTKHPNYRKTGDHDKNNMFGIDKYVAELKKQRSEQGKNMSGDINIDDYLLDDEDLEILDDKL